jgi:hypothetical protein
MVHDRKGVITAVFVDRINNYVVPIQQVAAIAGIQKDSREQTKEQEYESIFEEAKAREKEKERENTSVRKPRFGKMSGCYGKHAMELGFAELSIFDEIR